MSRAEYVQYGLFDGPLSSLLPVVVGKKNGRIRDPHAGVSNDNGTGATESAAPKPTASGAGNYRLTETRGLSAGWKSRANDNLTAIKILRSIEAEQRQATPEEQAKLVKFTAFSSSELAQNVFLDRNGNAKGGWEDIAYELAQIVSAEEKAGLMRATQYAHYTPEFVIRAIWDAVTGFGFGGGHVLEPGCGTGLFLAAAPDGVAERVSFYGVEADSITARIAAHILPESIIRHADFTQVQVPGDFDLAIGNPPFSERRVRSPEIEAALSLHDFFIVKALRALRPGGIGAFVVSRWTMDKVDSTARRLMADIADLVGAVRLPEKALRRDAGTDVVTDLLFFRRRLEGEGRNAETWLELAEVLPAIGADPAEAVNRFYADNPAAVLGQHARTSGRYGTTYTCAGDLQELGIALKAIIATLPKGIYLPTERAKPRGDAPGRVGFDKSNAQGGTIREGSYLLVDDRLHQIVDGYAVPIAVRGIADGSVGAMSRKSQAIITALLPIRDSVRAVLRAQEADRDWADAQQALTKAYRAFVAKYGPINKSRVVTLASKTDGSPAEYVRRPNLAPFLDDPDVWLVSSIEDYDPETDIACEGPIFTRRVVNAPSPRTVLSAADGLSLSLHDLGVVDVEYIAESIGQTAGDVISDLVGAIFRNPVTERWETADEYLSGAVRTKLTEAVAAASSDPSYAANVDALKAAQPVDLKPSEIAARLGAPWIEPVDLAAFSREVMALNVQVHHSKSLGTWTVNMTGTNSNAVSTQDWGTERRRAEVLLEDALNANIPRIYDLVRADGRETRVLNVKDTEAAKEKLTKIKEAFQNWIWTDAERTERLCKVYNATFNNLVPRHFDGSHLSMPGTSNAITFYPHQKRAIWRAISAGSMYIAHAVGAGKTISMAGAIMEQKRLGLISKAMLVVPGHCLAQASREFVMVYPNAKILVADETNFVKAKRQRFVARAATGNWDCIIITHSAFKFIAVPEGFENLLIEDALDELEVLSAEADNGDRVTRKRIEAQKEKYEAKMTALAAVKDDLLTLSEMGVDQLIVDEAQEFRKLSFATNQTTLLGVDPDGSQRAWDLFVKAKFVETRNPGRALIMASGTPITNTMGELYTTQRFFAADLLESMGLSAFDAWASNFGEVRTELELQPSGLYKPVTRFSEFVNVPELIDIFRKFADVVQKDDLRDYVTLPTVATGRRQVITAPATQMFKGYQRALDRRVKAIQRRSGRPEKGMDILLSVINDGRHAAIDLRLIDPTFPNDPESKLNVMIDNVARIYFESAEKEYLSPQGIPYEKKGGSQLIFSDIGTLEAEEKRGFSAYAWIRHRLIEFGVPADEIAIIHDYPKTADKLRLFTELKSGVKRVCIGSTKKMGTGVNAQLRLVALHHLDVPWLPADIEQRDGRIERQGNQNKEIHIYCYATLTSMDATLWQLNLRKQRFIGSAMSGDRSVRRLEDAGSQVNQFAMAKAIASGDQRLMHKAGLEAEVGRLFRLRDAHYDSQIAVRRAVLDGRAGIEYWSKKVEGYSADLLQRLVTSGDAFSMRFNDVILTERKAAGAALLQAMIGGAFTRRGGNRGNIGGFDFVVKLNVQDTKSFKIVVVMERNNGVRDELEMPDGVTALGIVSRIEKAIERMDRDLSDASDWLARARDQVADYEPRLGSSFDFQTELEAKMLELQELERDLAATEGSGSKFDELDEIANMFCGVGSHVPYEAPPKQEGCAKRDFDDEVVRMAA